MTHPDPAPVSAPDPEVAADEARIAKSLEALRRFHATQFERACEKTAAELEDLAAKLRVHGAKALTLDVPRACALAGRVVQDFAWGVANANVDNVVYRAADLDGTIAQQREFHGLPITG